MSLSEEERQIVKEEILFWHEERWGVHALTVMPDHVHVLATPLESAPGRWHSLCDILRNIKAGAALRINRLRGTRGSVWQHESFDRIVRNEREFQEKEGYIINNARNAGLVDDPWSFDGLWHPSLGPLGCSRASPRLEQADSSGRGIPPDAPIIKRRRKLPHWQLAGSTYFITFRLRQ